MKGRTKQFWTSYEGNILFVGPTDTKVALAIRLAIICVFKAKKKKSNVDLPPSQSFDHVLFVIFAGYGWPSGC